jgi:hypothetical protein
MTGSPLNAGAAPSIPYVPRLVRALLLADDPFVELCGGRLGTRAPVDITVPWAKLDVSTGAPILASAGAWRPLVQVGGWCAPGGGVDPEVAAWNIAARAAAVLCRVRNWPIDLPDVVGAWSVRSILEGPTALLDDSRGDSVPVYGAFVRAEVALHVTNT